MANFLAHRHNSPFSAFLVFFLLSLSFSLTKSRFSEQVLDPNAVANHLPNKMSHLHFYFHEVISGRHPTAVWVAGERSKFGMTTIMDDVLTEGTEHGSTVVGRVQGMYVVTSQADSSIFMAMTFAFVEGKYNGSTLSILGGVSFRETVRELPVVGGTGLFQHACGYALQKTMRFNSGTGDVVEEYNVFVMHH